MTSPDRIVVPGGARLRVGLGAVVVLVLAGLAVAALVTAFGATGTATTVVASGPVDAGAEAGADAGAATGPPERGATIFVHLLGAVAAPGLYELRAGDRAVDAIAAAGGFSAGADQSQLNLARLLADGEQIYVPIVGEVPSGVPPGATAIGGGSAGTTAAGKVDINTADAAALDTLPGVGPATAQRILDWREANGRFTAIEDLLSVTGIGDKTFAELKELVTI